MSELVTEQQPPTPNARPAIWPLVIADMQQRDHDGRAKYGVPVQPFNGRKALVDAYQEVLDLAVYLRQEIAEREALEAKLAECRSALELVQTHSTFIEDAWGKVGVTYRVLQAVGKALEASK